MAQFIKQGFVDNKLINDFFWSFQKRLDLLPPVDIMIIQIFGKLLDSATVGFDKTKNAAKVLLFKFFFGNSVFFNPRILVLKRTQKFIKFKQRFF